MTAGPTATPIFNDEIEYIVINPSWNVPVNIGKNEIIPGILTDSLYLQKQNMELLKNNQPVDPYTVDWNSLDENTISDYSFRQRPGKENALGSIKFIFPNEYDVYLHDTPAGQLFEEAERDFSHGCIRVKDPFILAEYLLKKDSKWNKQKITASIKSGQEQYIPLTNKVPIYIVYFTAWVDQDGIPNFREDIYGHDKKLRAVYFE